jgi:predicted alpha/beta superfamily hydrolase
MKSIARIILFMVLFSYCSGPIANRSPVDVSYGKVERLENFSSGSVTPRNIDIWLPDGYDKDREYAVVYMHDGQMLFDSSETWNKQEWGVDETFGKLIKAGRIRDCIVVGIWNISEERHPDYFPQKPFESLPARLKDSLINQAKRYGESDLFSMEVRSDRYLKFIMEELKPFIDKHYPTRTGRKDTFIMGSSMGGLISMYAICEYPEVFGGVACLSTHWTGTFTAENNPIPDAFIAYMNSNLPDPGTHKFYFDHGTETLDSIYEPYQVKVDSVMRRNGYTQKSWKTMKFNGADHSENAWRDRLHIPVLFLLGK